MRLYRMRAAGEGIATTEEIRVDSLRDSMAQRMIVTQ
jgi:hypothetical protein